VQEEGLTIARRPAVTPAHPADRFYNIETLQRRLSGALGLAIARPDFVLPLSRRTVAFRASVQIGVLTPTI
jgi:hypothetical protein